MSSDDELPISPITPGSELLLEANEKLQIIEWRHLDTFKFIPLTLFNAAAVRSAVYPLTVIRSRLQLQKQNSVYRGMTHALKKIYKTEGIRALYRGFWVTLPNLSTSLIYSTAYERLRDFLNTRFEFSHPSVVSALASGPSSFLTQLIFVPTDVISQYMMIYNKPESFMGGSSSKNFAVIDCIKADKRQNLITLKVIKAIYKVDGFFGFYRGFSTSLILFIPHSMIFWSSYYQMLSGVKYAHDSWIHGDFDRSKHTSSGNLLMLQAIAGLLGGVTAAICTNPLDVLRVRIQIHRTGYWETIRRLWKFEGFSMFTKGLVPRMIAHGTYSFLLMLGYESAKKLSVLPEYRHLVVW